MNESKDLKLFIYRQVFRCLFQLLFKESSTFHVSSASVFDLAQIFYKQSKSGLSYERSLAGRSSQMNFYELFFLGKSEAQPTGTLAMFNMESPANNTSDENVYLQKPLSSSCVKFFMISCFGRD